MVEVINPVNIEGAYTILPRIQNMFGAYWVGANL